jgi:hypothetical protein
MLITEILAEYNKRSDQTAVNSSQPPAVRVFFAKTFPQAFRDNVQHNQARSSVTKNLARFIGVKKQQPFMSFPGVDLHFDSSNPYAKKSIVHAKVGLDHRLFYSVFRRDTNHNYTGLQDHVIYLLLFGVFTHDASGIGTKENRNLQTKLADSFDQARTQVSSYREFTGQV